VKIVTTSTLLKQLFSSVLVVTIFTIVAGGRH